MLKYGLDRNLVQGLKFIDALTVDGRFFVSLHFLVINSAFPVFSISPKGDAL